MFNFPVHAEHLTDLILNIKIRLMAYCCENSKSLASGCNDVLYPHEGSVCTVLNIRKFACS